MSVERASIPNSIVQLGIEGILNVVEHFKYFLPKTFCQNMTNFKELDSRTVKASAAFRELVKVWRDRYINLDTKMKFCNACVHSTLLSDVSAGHSLREMHEAKLDAFDLHYQCKILLAVNVLDILQSGRDAVSLPMQ